MGYTEWQAVDGDFVVRIDNHIITQLTAYRQKLQGRQAESLGLIVGLVWENAFWVKAITTPTPFDKLSRFLCIRTQKSADYNFNLLKKLNKQSNYQWHYLGESIQSHPKPIWKVGINYPQIATMIKIFTYFGFVVVKPIATIG